MCVLFETVTFLICGGEALARRRDLYIFTYPRPPP